MISDNRVVAVIPARGGSKALPLKNLQPLGGKPLLTWPIDVALATVEIDRTIVSTDHAGIAEAALAAGAEVMDRPAHLATDTAVVADALRDVIARLRAEGETARYMVLLEPTAPFRLPRDVSSCLALLNDEKLDAVATFMDAHLNPHRAWRITEGHPDTFLDGATPWLPRQRLPAAYQLNGSVYAFVMDGLAPDTPSILFGRTGAVIMERERSFDIDTAHDFAIAEALLAGGHIPLE